MLLFDPFRYGCLSLHLLIPRLDGTIFLSSSLYIILLLLPVGPNFIIMMNLDVYDNDNDDDTYKLFSFVFFIITIIINIIISINRFFVF